MKKRFPVRHPCAIPAPASGTVLQRPFSGILIFLFVLIACCVVPAALSSGRPAPDVSFSGSWNQITNHTEWSPRIAFSTVVLPDGSIILMGGVGGDHLTDFYNDTWRSTDSGKTWTLLNASSGWGARVSQTSVVLPDGSIVLMGGAGKEGLKNDTWLSVDRGITWTCLNASSGWTARKQHTSAAMPDGSIVLMGGRDGNSLQNDTWRSTDHGATWSCINAGAEWEKRFMQEGVAGSDGSIILAGGYDNARYYNDVWRSTDTGATWKLVNGSAGWLPRVLHNLLAMPDGSIVLIGGGNKEYSTGLTDMWRSTDSGTTWSVVNTSTLWPVRLSQKCVVLPDGSIILFGGMADKTLNDVWRFTTTGSTDTSPVQPNTMPVNATVHLPLFKTGK
jgi:hypothetical protein